MKILLNPRTNEAYGQDFLAKALLKSCGLIEAVTGNAGTYTVPSDNLDLVVSMNLDEDADSHFISTLPETVKTVAHIHCRNSFYSDAERANIAFAIGRVNLGIALAEFHQTELKQVFPTVDWRVVNNGIDRSRFRVSSEEERSDFKRRLFIDDSKKLILFVGRLEDAKGLQILRECCRLISDTKLALVIQFPANSNKAKKNYEKIALELQSMNSDQIALYPDTDLSTDRPVRHVDMMLTPSLSEVAPLVVLEAFSAGVAVIGTNATPYYEKFSELGIPSWAFRFINFPSDENLNVERKSLKLKDKNALSIAEELLGIAVDCPMTSDADRVALSRAAEVSGFSSREKMLAGFKAIYDEALANSGT